MTQDTVTTAQPIDLEVCPVNEGFALVLDGEILKTRSGGSRVIHAVPDLLEHMASEFDGQGTLQMKEGAIVEPSFLGAYGLFEIQKEWIELERDDLTVNFGPSLVNDPILNRVAGPEQVDQLARWGPVMKWLDQDFAELSGLVHELRYDKDASGSELDDIRNRINAEQAVVRLSEQYLALGPEERAVVMMLFAHHDVLLWPMALVLGHCTTSEYALGVMACHALLSGVFGDVEDSDHNELFRNLREDARTAVDYIRFYRKGTMVQRIHEVIEAGEGAKSEFKSTLRWNLKANKKDDEITHACVKTVAAFLNSKGGTLLVGVGDNGSVVGIDKDGFLNDDKFLLFFWGKLKAALGEGVSAHVTTAIEVIPVASGKVCLIECQPSGDPVYCKKKGGGEEFYIRTGPGTSALSPSEMVKYMKERFQ